MKLGLLCSRIRVEEKLLIKELEKRGVDYDVIDDRSVVLDLAAAVPYPGGESFVSLVTPTRIPAGSLRIGIAFADRSFQFFRTLPSASKPWRSSKATTIQGTVSR